MMKQIQAQHERAGKLKDAISRVAEVAPLAARTWDGETVCVALKDPLQALATAIDNMVEGDFASLTGPSTAFVETAQVRLQEIYA